jgi:hypothetical protein
MSFLQDDEEFAKFIATLDTASRREFDTIMFKATIGFHKSTQVRLDKLEARVNYLFVILGFLVAGSSVLGPVVTKLIGI